jgi:hypothetical protein
MKQIIYETLIKIDEQIYRVSRCDYSKSIKELIESCILCDHDLEIINYITHDIVNPR